VTLSTPVTVPPVASIGFCSWAAVAFIGVMVIMLEVGFGETEKRCTRCPPPPLQVTVGEMKLMALVPQLLLAVTPTL